MAPRSLPAKYGAQVSAGLRATREARGLNRSQLDRLAGVNGLVHQVEKRATGMSVATLFALVEALGCTWGEVLGPEPGLGGERRTADWEAGFRAGLGEAHAAVARVRDERR